MMRNFIFCKLILFLVFVVSCQKEINVDLPPHQSKLSLDCHLISGEVPEAIVSSSLHSLAINSTFNALPSAEVLLFEDEELVDTLLHYNETFEEYPSNYDVGVFRGDYIIQPGKVYKIQVSHINYETIFGEVICPNNRIEISEIDISGLMVDSMESYLNVGVYEYFRSGQVKFKIAGLLDSELHYLLSITDAGNEVDAFNIISRDPLIATEEWNVSEDGTVYPSPSVYFSGSGSNLNTVLTFDINPEGTWLYEKNISDGIEIRLEIQKDDYFQFMKKVDQYELSQSNPFVEMVFLPDNIEGGYGFVSGRLNYREVSD